MKKESSIKNMSKIAYLLLLSVIVMWSCNGESRREGKRPGKSFFEAFTYEKVVWERYTISGKYKKMAKPNYTKGEVVILSLKNVTGFAASPKGDAKFEMSTLVLDADENEVYKKINFLQESGNFKTDNGVVASVKGVFQSSISMKPGKYTFIMVLSDVYGEEEIFVEEVFTLR